jgi:hypothetical protein
MHNSSWIFHSGSASSDACFKKITDVSINCSSCFYLTIFTECRGPMADIDICMGPEEEEENAIVHIQPPPPRHQSQSQPSIDEMFPGLRRMKRLGRSGQTAGIQLQTASMLPTMYGMANIDKLLWDAVVKPSVVPATYRSTCGRLTGLHFGLIGPRGSGKHSAVRMVCAQMCIEMVTISPKWYEFGDIHQAISFASYDSPAIVYFDEFAALAKRDAFVAEFYTQVLGQDDMCTTWSNIWLAFAFESEEEMLSLPEKIQGVTEICRSRRACVCDLSESESINYVIGAITKVVSVPVRIIPNMSEEQYYRLGLACRGCTPRELEGFAGDVVYNALRRMDLKTLAQMNNIPIIGSQPLQLPPRQPMAGPDDSIAAFVQGYGGRAAASPLPASACRQQLGCVIDIEWSTDAERMYNFLPADCNDGYIELPTIKQQWNTTVTITNPGQ